MTKMVLFLGNLLFALANIIAFIVYRNTYSILVVGMSLFTAYILWVEN